MEREQLDIWRQTRPGERIVDIGEITQAAALDIVVFLFKHFVAYSTGEICIHTKHNTKDIGLLQTIKGWYTSTTYRTPKKIKKAHKNKHEMIVQLNQKLGEEKGLLQFASQNVFTARCYASAVLAMALCPSVRPSVRLSVSPSQAGVLLKRQNVGSHKQQHTTAQGL